jgi:hypothetical protein
LGNILVNRVPEDKVLKVRFHDNEDDDDYIYIPTKGLQVSIIDYTLSRMKKTSKYLLLM